MRAIFRAVRRGRKTPEAIDSVAREAASLRRRLEDAVVSSATAGRLKRFLRLGVSPSVVSVWR